ncbi:UPF0148 family protein [Halobacterium hubeiense]|uniref:UPF0148 family protein n=2 Tax=Halobacterium hubeiense TaxID=1407499 RepID=A0A0U5D176_9EURY|nr:Sjogren's syndrome/scleroderma autoantigen 1 family protein [Halobacterium hubeiense]CQH62352.1 UPF0148 family protein [Halobacterium hubeiense]
MSDTDDGFDEEAVREELREKYADDDRGETERMSELLLQGATMTNQHCDRCGNPIFRYEGESFCPNCQQAAEQQQAAQQQAAQQDAGQQRADAQERPARQSQQSASGETEAAESARAGRQPGNAAERQPPAEARQPADRQASQPAREQRSAPTEQPAARGEPAASAATGEAADALESSIAALARRGASADDPRRAREFLEAAREAAEALDALHRNA